MKVTSIFAVLALARLLVDSTEFGIVRSYPDVIGQALELKDFSTAREATEHWLTKEPRNPDAHNALGAIQLLENDSSLAMTSFLKGLELRDYEEHDGIQANVAMASDHLATHEILRFLQVHNSTEFNKFVFVSHSLLVHFRTNGRHEAIYPLLRLAVRQWQNLHSYWREFYRFGILFNASENLNTGEFGDVPLQEFNELLDLGLSLFPSCPGLLYLNGLRYELEQKNHLCAVSMYSRSISYERFFPSAELRALPRQRLQLLEPSSDVLTEFLWKSRRSCYPLQELRNASLDWNVSMGNAGDGASATWERRNYSVQFGCTMYTCIKAGWIIIDAVANPSTHIVAEANNLTMVDSNVVDRLYSSHILEHVSHSYVGDEGQYPEGEVCATLREWHRILKPNGTIYISVPDIEILARLLAREAQGNYKAKLVIMTILYGGQDHKYNFHKAGFFHEYLAKLMADVGFCDINRVDDFGIFEKDSSSMTVFGQKFSLNLMARKCTDHEIAVRGGHRECSRMYIEP